MADLQHSTSLPLSSSQLETTRDTSSTSNRPRMTTASAYFTPGAMGESTYFQSSASTFRPQLRPFQHHSLGQLLRPQRSEETVAALTPIYPRGHLITRAHTIANPQPSSMDPSPGDIGAVFLHPPFRDFPGADRYLDGLTYDLMNENPDWFLDPVDFRHEGNTNPNAIDYPQQLEPGRKKKSTGQASAEEPRYRCTFCRRSYAGVNAKSMWRRHVFEKHKIGMWNRRDPQDRKGGRNANKENKGEKRGRGTRRKSPRDAEQDSSKIYATQGVKCAPSSSKSDTLASKKKAVEVDSDDEATGYPAPTLVHDGDSSFDSTTSVLRPYTGTPPLTPSNSPLKLGQSNGGLGDTSFESPYDPLQTPQFRHSPDPLPAKQPWRFPSPSHPLASNKDLSLSALMAQASPAVHGFDSSPMIPAPGSERRRTSLLSSPFTFTADTRRDSPGFPVPSPRRLFEESIFQSHTPFKMPPSPLGLPFSSPKQTPKGSAKKSKSTLSEVLKGWQPELPHSPLNLGEGPAGSLGPAIELRTEDIITDDLYGTWASGKSSPPRPKSGATSPAHPAAIVDESPVVRCALQHTEHPGTSHRRHFVSPLMRSASHSAGPSRIGRRLSGTGLMDAVLTSREKSRRVRPADDDSDSGNSLLESSPFRGLKKARKRHHSGWHRERETSGDADSGEFHLKKRRITLDGRQ